MRGMVIASYMWPVTRVKFQRCLILCFEAIAPHLSKTHRYAFLVQSDRIATAKVVRAF